MTNAAFVRPSFCKREREKKEKRKRIPYKKFLIEYYLKSENSS